MTHRIASVRLVDIASPAYRQFCSRKAYLARVIGRERVADPRQACAQRVEEVVRRSLAATGDVARERILTWRELDHRLHWIVRFRELDAVVRLPGDETRIVEVKSSWSKSCARSGAEQIRGAMNVLARACRKVTGMLVLVDFDGAGDGLRPLERPAGFRRETSLGASADLGAGEASIVHLTRESFEAMSAEAGVSMTGMADGVSDDEPAAVEQGDSPSGVARTIGGAASGGYAGALAAALCRSGLVSGTGSARIHTPKTFSTASMNPSSPLPVTPDLPSAAGTSW